jgi:hypothetical protein
MRIRKSLAVALIAAAAAALRCAAQPPPSAPAPAPAPPAALPLQPVLDGAGNYTHDPDVTSRVILVSSTGLIIECSQPKTAAHPAAVWRERYSIFDGKIALAAVITEHLVPPQPAHDEWEETTISHSPPEAPKPKSPSTSIGADGNPGSPAISSAPFDPRWSGFSGYLNKMTTAVQTEWDHIRITNNVYPKSGTLVTVKFVMNSKGMITRIVNVDTAPGTPDVAGRTCVAAITAHQPYGDWTDEMVATLGTDQEMTLSFYYP